MSSSNLPHVLLLTGLPGIGKTTVIRKVARELRKYRLGGFYTEEIRTAGQRKGFRLITFNHEEGVIAHVDFDQRCRVGRYGVDVAAIDRFSDIALSIKADIDVYLIDEIGKMECLSNVFVRRIQSLLESEKTTVATVGMKGSGLIEEVKRWPDSRLWEITRANRDVLVQDVMQWLQEHL